MTTKAWIILAFMAMPSFFFWQKNEKFATELKTGNAKGLATFFASKIEINMPHAEGLYSKNQAEQLLKNFFSQYPPTNYVQLHAGSSTGKQETYLIGKLSCKNQEFRSFILYHTENNMDIITELRFEPEKE